MKTNLDKKYRRWGLPALLLVTALIVAACGGDDPTPTPAPPAPTATTAPAASPTEAPAAAPESPLSQPESPLSQPESPLTTETTTETPIDTNWARSEEDALAVAANTVPPEPQPGMASVGGVLFSYGINEVVPATQFYLTAADEVDGKLLPPSVYFGPRANEGDVVSDSTQQGQIQLDNVPPGNYYMMVWTVYSWLPIFESPESQMPILITVEEGQKLDLGMVYLNWP